MKTQAQRLRSVLRATGRGRLSWLSPVAVAAALLFVAAFAEGAAASASSGLQIGGRSGTPIPPPGGQGDIATDTDEGVGTLPVIIDPDADTTIAGLLPDRLLAANGLVRPYISLTGSWADIGAVVIEAGGKGVVTVTPSGDLDGEFRFGFHGDVDVELDIEQLRLRSMKPSVNTEGEFDGGLAAVCWNGNCTPPTSLPSASALLPFQALLDSGILQQSSVQLLAVSPTQSSVTVDFSLASETTLRVSQRIQ